MDATIEVRLRPRAPWLDVTPFRVVVLRGKRSRDKLVRVEEFDSQALERLLRP